MQNDRVYNPELPQHNALPEAPQEYVNREFEGIIAENYGQFDPSLVVPAPATEAGLYKSRVAAGEELSHDGLERVAVAPHAGNLATEAAIGMAALPEEYQNQQLNRLTYRGMTSEQYAAEHAARWFAFRQQQEEMARLALAANEDTNTGGKKKRKRKRGEQDRHENTYTLAA